MNFAKGQYWDKALNFWTGCTKVTQGCEHCWAIAMKNRFPQLRAGKPYPFCPTINFLPILENIFCGALKLRKDPTVYALQWLGDLWHPEISPYVRSKILDFIASYPQHTFLALTKRPQYVDSRELPMNLFMGTSVENEDNFKRIIDLRERVEEQIWISFEPLLSSVKRHLIEILQICNQVIVGGETGTGARPMNPDWVREIRDYCKDFDIPFFLKYMNKKDGRILDGQTHNDLIWRKI